MTLFEQPIWVTLRPYAHLDLGRDNLDLHKLPDHLRDLAMKVESTCIACGAPIFPLRARAKSKRSRVGGSMLEKRLFYAPTCPTEKNPGCSRTQIARGHKRFLRGLFAGAVATTTTETGDDQ